MTTINPAVSPATTTVTEQAPAFKGKNKIAKSVADKIMPKVTELTPEQAFKEQVAGMACAAKTPDKEMLKNIVMRETALGHFDFVKGINEFLSHDAAKKVYKK